MAKHFFEDLGGVSSTTCRWAKEIHNESGIIDDYLLRLVSANRVSPRPGTVDWT